VSPKRLTLCVLLSLAACSDPNETRQAVEAMGMKDVQPEGYAWFGCGRDDDQRTRFTATNPNGQRVEGVACSNWSPFGKATTVRIVRVLGRAGGNAVPVAQ
jgi:hypothetical protein